MTTQINTPSKTREPAGMRDSGFGWVDAGLRIVAFMMIAGAGLMQAKADGGAAMGRVGEAVPQLAQIGSGLKAVIATLVG
jgi:hypothetical protein